MMVRLTSVSWREFVERMRQLGFEGPYAGGRHPQMRRGDVTVHIMTTLRRISMY